MVRALLALALACSAWAQPFTLNDPLMKAPGGSAFTPLAVGGLVLWLDATASIADGQTITNWPDLSGTGNHCTNATTANCPVGKAAVVGGKMAAYFDGSNDKLIPTTQYYCSNTFTYFVVMSRTNTADYMLGLADSGDAEYTIWQYNNGNVYTTPAFRSFFKANNVTGPVLWSQTWEKSASVTNTVVYQTGTNISITQYATGVAGNGLWNRMGATDARFGKGYIAEMLFYTNLLADADRVSVETFLRGKYGL